MQFANIVSRTMVELGRHLRARLEMDPSPGIYCGNERGEFRVNYGINRSTLDQEELVYYLAGIYLCGVIEIVGVRIFQQGPFKVKAPDREWVVQLFGQHFLRLI